MLVDRLGADEPNFVDLNFNRLLSYRLSGWETSLISKKLSNFKIRG